MNQLPLPTTIAEVEALILSLYQPNPPETIARTQSILTRLQNSPHAWSMARDLLGRPDEKVKFFGALTIIVKLNTESSSLSDGDAKELLVVLIGWYMDSISHGTGPLVVRKLSSTLATFFLHFPRIWNRFVRHLALRLASGHPGPLETLDETSALDPLLEQLNPAQIQAILWVLTNILEDVTKFDLNSGTNMGLYDTILKNMPDTVALLTRAMSSPPTFCRAHQDATKCLQSWVWFAQRTSSRDAGLIQSLSHLITTVINSLTVEELYDSSAELMVDLLSNSSIFLSETHFDALSRLFETPWFERKYQELLQGDFEFESVRFGHLLLAFGDVRVEKLIQANDERSRNFLAKLCGLLAAHGYPVAEDKIFVPALEFWSTFAETMTDCMYSDGEASKVWAPPALAMALQAVSNAWQKASFPPPEEFAAWDSNERVGFHDSRKDIVDLLQSVYVLAGPQLVLTFADLMLNALSNSSWPQLEAAAFCLGGLAECIPEDDTRCDHALGTVFQSPLFSVLHPGLVAIPSRVRQTCVSLIEHYNEYFERNVTHLPAALNLLFAVVGEKSMAAAAAKSIIRLCSSCRLHLYPEVGTFLDEYQSLVGAERLDCVASEKILGGIAAVIQATPEPAERYSACARLLSFVEADAHRSLELSQTQHDNQIACFRVPHCPYASSDENAAFHTGLRALKCLASMGKGLQAPADAPLNLDGDRHHRSKSPPQLAQLQEQIISIMIQMQGAFEASGEVNEIICNILRSGFSEVEPGPFVLPKRDVANFLLRHTAATRRIGLFVSTACSFVSSLEHDGLQRQHDYLKITLVWVVGLLKQLPDPEADPELSQNGIDFVSRLLSKRPETLLQLEHQDVTEFFFLYTLRVLDGSEPLPKASAAEFWAHFISIKTGNVELEDIIARAMSTLGPLLSQCLMRNLGGNAARSELDKLSEPLKKLISRYPLAKTWLETALSDPSFPSSKVTAEDKTMFIKKIVSLRGARPTNQVVREFWLSARGSSFAYAS